MPSERTAQVGGQAMFVGPEGIVANTGYLVFARRLSESGRPEDRTTIEPATS